MLENRQRYQLYHKLEIQDSPISNIHQPKPKQTLL
jgi:hypothetical protein